MMEIIRNETEERIIYTIEKNFCVRSPVTIHYLIRLLVSLEIILYMYTGSPRSESTDIVLPVFRQEEPLVIAHKTNKNTRNL